jgi:hypothetical protein
MIDAPEQSERSAVECAYRPPAPKPQARPLRTWALLRTLQRNPLECWAEEHFERPIVVGGLPIGHVLLVHEPAAIRRVLLDNAAKLSQRPSAASGLVRRARRWPVECRG